MKKMGLTSEDIEPPKNDPEYNPEAEKKKDSKAEKRKHFHSLGPQMKKIRIQPILDQIIEKAGEEVIDPGEVIAEAGKNYHNSEAQKSKAKIYTKILNDQNPFENQELTVKEAVALKVCSHSVQIIEFSVIHILREIKIGESKF